MYDLVDVCMAKGMHLAHLNIRSLVNKWEIFKTQFIESNLHFIGLSETWLNEKIPSDILKLSDEYTLIRNDRNWTEEGANMPKKGGGVAIYVRNNLKFSETNFKHLNSNSKDIESQWITISLPNSKPLLIGNIYRPPQGNVDAFIQVLENVLNEIDSNKFELYMMGDVNIDMLDKLGEAYRKITTFTKSMGLCQLIKNPTRYSTARNSLLDICFTNSDYIQRSGVCDINLSDHQMILITRKKVKVPKKKCTFTGRSYRNYSKIDFQAEIVMPTGMLITLKIRWMVNGNSLSKSYKIL